MEWMANELSELRGELCRSATDFCHVCFEGSVHRRKQNPPNVFRVAGIRSPDLFFVIEKPNDNDAFRTSDAVPISVFDHRPLFGFQSSYVNFLHVLELLGLAGRTPDQDPIDAGLVHVTNAVKCDRCAATGKTGPVKINKRQVKTCVNRFLLRELSILRPKALVFFGEASQKYVCGDTTDMWMCREAVLGDRSYWTMRVPHPAPRSYNKYGDGGHAYVEPFKTLKVRAGIQ
jgi:hypothetical protein